MGHTLFDKLWDLHTIKSIDQDTDVIYIDHHFIHEVTSPQAFSALNSRGIRVFRPNLVTATADHNVPTVNQHLPIEDELSRTQVDTLTRNCEEHGINYYGIGHEKQGIVHVIGPEQGITQPGMTIVCGDSHTSTHGAFGAIAFGIGTTQVEQVLASQALILKRPKTMKIQVEGELDQWVTAKDIVLYVIAQLGTKGATGHFIEFCGSTIRGLSMEERMTVCNMSIEMGARGGMVGVDQTTIDYVSSKAVVSERKLEFWRGLNSDDDADFSTSYLFHASAISPMITCGTSPDTGISLKSKIGTSRHLTQKALDYMGFQKEESILGKKIDYVFIGSCTNSRIEDLRQAARIVKDGRKAKHVKAWVVPGSKAIQQQAIAEGLDKTFTNAGFEFREPGCSACLAMNSDKIPSGALCVSTSNRNFEGRQGDGARTLLASPVLAAACAMKGEITDVTAYAYNQK